jgi:2-polyprenyl-3-methyl-5-hydroxy-6-metoxy-1,4-benzoquinol methylase
MSDRSLREKEFHNKAVDGSGGLCWANITPAGQLRQDIRARMAVDYIRISKVSKVLEIGCGNGEFSKRFLRTGAEMHCVDISEKAIALLKEQYKGTNLIFEPADVEHLQFPDNHFDGIIGNGILHHLNLDACLGELFRVLKPGGRIFFSEPNMMNPEVFLESNVRWIGKLAQKSEDETAFFRWRMAKALRQHGFTAIEVVPFDFLQPLTPKPLINFVQMISRVLEKTPLFREIAGSLRIVAAKATQ